MWSTARINIIMMTYTISPNTLGELPENLSISINTDHRSLRLIMTLLTFIINILTHFPGPTFSIHIPLTTLGSYHRACEFFITYTFDHKNTPIRVIRVSMSILYQIISILDTAV